MKKILEFNQSKIKDIKLIKPSVYEDERGFFFESFNHKDFEKTIGYSIRFVQDNHSKSVKGVLRGLHYQLPPYAQGKLVRVVRGEIFDVAVDIRKSSQTFCHWVGVNLSAENKNQLWIPEGFAHGFLTLSDTAECIYKTTNYYSKAHERIIRWDDPSFNISWPKNIRTFLSKKDRNASLVSSDDIFA